MTARAISIALCLGSLLCATTAQAALKLCNRTSYILYAATGYASGLDAITQGWTRIVPGDCEPAIPGALRGSTYFVYARTSLAHSGATRAWGGKQNLCVKNADFSLTTPLVGQRCPSDDSFELPFATINTKRKLGWTMTFDEAPALTSMKDAVRAGTKRLLRDEGAHIATVDAKPDKPTDVALQAFRKRLNMQANASDMDLFDALETEALKTTAPSGYSVCNDTAQPVWVALGESASSKWVSRGWWKIAAGGCAKTVSEALKTDQVYLAVQTPAGAPIVSGPNKFCVTAIEFEIQGRGNCASRGLTEVGFAATRTRGLAGFAAHIGDHGLLPPPKPYSGNPK